jgi:hypothetical protein
MKKLFTGLLLLCLNVAVMAQPVERLVKIVITPDHADWLIK